MTATSTAMIAIDQIGYYGMNAKLATVLSAATNTPTVRASTFPVMIPSPERIRITPSSRCTQPHW